MRHWLNGTLVGCTRERFWPSGLEASPHIHNVECVACIQAHAVCHEIGKARRAQFEAKERS